MYPGNGSLASADIFLGVWETWPMILLPVFDVEVFII
jgi:hypothetical protein